MVHHVEGPPKGDFVDGPGRVPLVDLLGGDGILEGCVSGVVGAEHLVDGG